MSFPLNCSKSCFNMNNVWQCWVSNLFILLDVFYAGALTFVSLVAAEKESSPVAHPEFNSISPHISSGCCVFILHNTFMNMFVTFTYRLSTHGWGLAGQKMRLRFNQHYIWVETWRLDVTFITECIHCFNSVQVDYISVWSMVTRFKSDIEKAVETNGSPFVLSRSF